MMVPPAPEAAWPREGRSFEARGIVQRWVERGERREGGRGVWGFGLWIGEIGGGRWCK